MSAADVLLLSGVPCFIDRWLPPDGVWVFRGAVFAGSRRALDLAIAEANAELRFAALDAALIKICSSEAPP